MIDIKTIQSLHGEEAVVLTQHFSYRIDKRGIEISDVEFAISNGEIIEQYPDDYPHPSVLIMGHTNDFKPLHVVVGVGGGFAWMITAYYPDSAKWENNFMTRKAEK